MTDHVHNVIKGLDLWKKIVQFLTISSIEDLQMYEQKMEEYKLLVKQMYDVGTKTFRTSKNDIGKEKTFYMHVFRFYIPTIAKITYKKHGLGGCWYIYNTRI